MKFLCSAAPESNTPGREQTGYLYRRVVYVPTPLNEDISPDEVEDSTFQRCFCSPATSGRFPQRGSQILLLAPALLYSCVHGYLLFLAHVSATFSSFFVVFFYFTVDWIALEGRQ